MTKKSSNLESLFCGILLCISIAALVIACLAYTQKKPGGLTMPPPKGKCNSSNNCCCNNSLSGEWGSLCTQDGTCGQGSYCAYLDEDYDVVECGN